jgi:hypothetical protein
LLIFLYYIVKFFFIDGRSFGLVINSAKNQGVDLAVVRAILETEGKLAKTTVTNEKGRYSLVLPKGFYKIIVTKPELKQASPLSIRVKNNLKPRTEKIRMIETRAETNSNPLDKFRTGSEYRNSKQTLNSNPLHPTPYSSPSTPNSPLHTPSRSFSDSGEIVERYGEKSKKYNTNDLSDIGLHHLIMPKKMEEEISETNKEISNSSPNKKESDSDHPNWQLPNSSSPL